MLDIAYGIRVLRIFLKSKKNQNYKNIFSESIVNASCWPNDLDINWHMNNSRYLRECDFGRISFLIETGLWNSILEQRKKTFKNANVIVSALQVQYRQSVELFDKFHILTRIDGWDETSFYFQQSMILNKNNQTAFSIIVRQTVIPRNLTPQILVDQINKKSIQSPKLSFNMENFRQNHRLTYSKIE